MVDAPEFYHVQIELKRHDEHGNIIKYCELDIVEKNEIVKSIVVPFLQGKEFQVDGHFVSKNEIERFCIRKQKRLPLI